MEISNSGRIVIIDDKYNEAKLLLEIFGKKGLPYIYYDGETSKLPEKPHCGIRFVFLDIELQGMEGQSDITKASGLIGRLKKVISKKNGPYIIVFWTRHKEVIKLVLENCKKAEIHPVTYLDLEKSHCIDRDGKYDINILKAKIEKKLKSIGAFLLYVAWENGVNQASKEFVFEFSNPLQFEDPQLWSEKTSALFHELYRTYAGGTTAQSDMEKFKYATHLLNRSFLDTLEIRSTTQLTLPPEFKLNETEVDGDTRAKLNSSLFLEKSPPPESRTGYVYIENNDSLQYAIKKKLVKEKKELNDCQLCKILITPECDLANNKTIVIEGSRLHRIVYGLFYSSVQTDLKNESKKFNNKGKDARFVIGPLWLNLSTDPKGGKTYWIVLDFLTLSTQAEQDLGESPLFSIKRDLVFDLQSKTANHVNRLGNFLL